METRRTSFRLTDADLARIAVIREHYGLSSSVEAVRFALRRLYRSLGREEDMRKEHIDAEV